MPQLGDFLDRFRPAGAPGAATRAGVPADRVAELSAELDPVLAMLAATDAQCARIVAEAGREASRIAGAARERAVRIAADGGERAQAARGEAATAVLAAARAEATATEHAAAQASASRPGPSDADVQALIRAAVDLVRSMPDGGRDR